MSKIFDGGPAFPRERKFHYEADTKPGSGMLHDPPQDGMTLRDYFAAKAMQTLLDHLTNGDMDKFQEKAFTMISETSYFMADAMLKTRVK